ncbi:AAA family ATPase [Ignavibacterium sp.]|uniref:ATP-dependent DNA helicase n=1 Tax=Ignavibacterium sp. TaxID=2651167 RepID=UPI00220ADB42|nr:AAA family ATPase [Ignavibacterium sp.]BDQ01540.1 MAG: hypothetical protein KatS3mg037_0115 [Ignavibacterium sp.]
MNISHNILSKICSSTNLTDSQRIALTSVNEFLNSTDYNVAIISGSAGTGKTFLLNLITEALERAGIPFQVATPTGRSSQVLRSKGIKQVGTIHSKIYSYNEIIEEKSKGDFIYYFKLKSNQDSTNTVYLIDESSMISNKFNQDEILRYGSGFLLNDLINFISPNYSNQRKIIFFGDINQLPPINSSESPALNKDYLEALSFGIRVKELKLKEIVRQTKNSSIIRNAQIIKNQLENKNITSFKLEFDEKEFIEIQPNKVIKHFCDSFIIENQSTVLISYTNAAVMLYNQSIREKLFNNPSLLEKNDRIIVIRNNGKYRLLNGEMGIVKWISPYNEIKFVNLKNEKEPQELIFRKVTLEFFNEFNEIVEVSPLILENLLVSPESTLTRKEARALMVDFVNRHKEVKRNSKEFAELLQQDPYFNCLLIKHGYAITCHKAQGGEWPYVYFDFRFPSSYSSDYLRFCYTAITRAKKVLYAINPPSSWSVPISADSQNFCNLKVSDDNPKENTISEKAVIDLIEKYLSGQTLKYEVEIKPYRIRLNYFINNKPRHTDIVYRKDGTISSIQSDEISEKNLIHNILISIKEKRVIDKKKVDFNSPIVEQLVKDVQQRLLGSGIIIDRIEHFNYQERYYFSDGVDSCSVNIYYNSKNRVTSINPHKGEKSLMTKIIKLLNE